MFGSDKLMWGKQLLSFSLKILPLFPPARHLSLSFHHPCQPPTPSIPHMPRNFCFPSYFLFFKHKKNRQNCCFVTVLSWISKCSFLYIVKLVSYLSLHVLYLWTDCDLLAVYINLQTVDLRHPLTGSRRLSTFLISFDSISEKTFKIQIW